MPARRGDCAEQTLSARQGGVGVRVWGGHLLDAGLAIGRM